VSPAVAAQLRAAAARSPIALDGEEIEVDVHEHSGHAFFADYRPTYHPEAAAKPWAEVLPFLQRHLQSS